MNNVLEYAKDARNAFSTYMEKSECDYSVCERIYNYIKNIELLNDSEKKDLDSFISQNTIKVVHLANVYSISDEKSLKRMVPINLEKPSANIYEAHGDFESLLSKREVRTIKIKTYPKKAA